MATHDSIQLLIPFTIWINDSSFTGDWGKQPISILVLDTGISCHSGIIVNAYEKLLLTCIIPVIKMPTILCMVYILLNTKTIKNTLGSNSINHKEYQTNYEPGYSNHY